MKVKIKRLHENAIIPSYAKPGDAGLDLVAIGMKESLEFIEYSTGIAVEIPQGYVGLIYPRSSISKKDLLLCNSVGVVDSGYRGEITFRFQKLGPNVFEVGERVGQIIIVPYPQIEFEERGELSESARGEDGYGSSGL